MDLMPTRDQVLDSLRSVIDPELRRDIVELEMVRSIDIHDNGVRTIGGFGSLTGVMRWVGALEIIGHSPDNRPIWTDDFPIRLQVKPLVALEPEHGIPMEALQGKVDFYRGRFESTW